MAFQRPLSLNGVTYPAAYTRIIQVSVSSTAAGIIAGTYENVEARERGDNMLHFEHFSTMPSSLVGDTYKLAYDHMKTQPGFEEAITYPDGDDVKPPAAAPAPAAG